MRWRFKEKATILIRSCVNDEENRTISKVKEMLGRISDTARAIHECMQRINIEFILLEPCCFSTFEALLLEDRDLSGEATNDDCFCSTYCNTKRFMVSAIMLNRYLLLKTRLWPIPDGNRYGTILWCFGAIFRYQSAGDKETLDRYMRIFSGGDLEHLPGGVSRAVIHSIKDGIRYGNGILIAEWLKDQNIFVPWWSEEISEIIIRYKKLSLLQWISRNTKYAEHNRYYDTERDQDRLNVGYSLIARCNTKEHADILLGLLKMFKLSHQPDVRSRLHPELQGHPTLEVYFKNRFNVFSRSI